MATHASILAWEIPWTEERGRLQSMASQRARHGWATEHHLRKHFFFFLAYLDFLPTHLLPGVSLSLSLSLSFYLFLVIWNHFHVLPVPWYLAHFDPQGAHQNCFSPQETPGYEQGLSHTSCWETFLPILHKMGLPDLGGHCLPPHRPASSSVGVFSSTQFWILFQLTEAHASEFAPSSAAALLT